MQTFTNFYTDSIDTETTCGLALQDWPASFNVTWAQEDRASHPDGPSRGSVWVVERAEFYRAVLGDRATDRDALIQMVGASEVARIEESAAQSFMEQGPEMAVAA
jgi:hypothetical protein